MSVKPESIIVGAAMPKREYLADNADRISFDADAENLWAAYEGSHNLAAALWLAYEKRGRELGVSAAVASLMLNYRADKEAASAAMGVPARRV